MFKIGVICMKAVGLIVEYNPLHNGHLHHIEQAKLKSNAELVIAVMSGNFLQRGEPAIVDKFTRAKMAVEQHVDLVIELPTIYTVQHSDIFAYGAISILNTMKVDQIIFGSEQGQIEPFINTYDQIKKNQTRYDQELKRQLQKGANYPTAHTIALEVIGSNQTLDLKMPNNILGLSYIKAQQQINPNLKIDTIKRIQANYHQTQLSYPITSATSIRQQLSQSFTGETHESLSMPESSYQLLLNYYKITDLFHDWELYFPLLKYRIMSDSFEQLNQIHGMEEGIEHRLKKMIIASHSFAQFIEKTQTKRYTKTRLQRLFVHLLLQLTKDEVSRQLKTIDEINDIRILAMNQAGQSYLNQLKNTTELNFISQLKKKQSDQLAIDEKASSIYYLPLKFEAQQLLWKQELTPPFKV